MLGGLIFAVLFFAAAGYVLVKGDRFHRAAIGVMLIGVIATYLIYTLGSHKWLPLNAAVLAIDILALLAFAWIAVLSRTIWPLLVTGWQIAAVTIHLASSFAVDLVPNAYGIGQGVWAYLQFATILFATVLNRRQQKSN